MYKLFEIAGMEVDSYLRSFKWDESKFPRNVTISETIKEISKKVYMIEADLRNKTQQYQDKKNLLSQLSKKETYLSLGDRSFI